ncbi:prepilin peptidase [bacterium]|nr:prepilin peptidase [bacterium]
MLGLIYFIFGAVIGSFLNVVIYRLPRGENIAFPASHCQSCNTPLKPWHNIPLLSWLFLRGRCAFCGEKISMQYPIIELLSGLIFMSVFLKDGPSIATFGIAAAFLTLLTLSMIDFYYKAVPDSLNLLALTLAIFSVSDVQMLGINFVNALLLAGGFTLLRFYLSYYLYARTKAFVRPDKKASWVRNYNPMPLYFEAMGEGDIMVAATMGALMGVQLSLVAVFLSALIALPAILLTRGKDADSHRLPFVPFLALAAYVVYMLDTPILAYLKVLYE